MLCLQYDDMQVVVKCSFSFLYLSCYTCVCFCFQCVGKFKLPIFCPLISLPFLFQIIIILLHTPQCLLQLCWASVWIVSLAKTTYLCSPLSFCYIPIFRYTQSSFPFRWHAPCFGVTDPPRLSPLPTVSHLTPYFTAELRLISPQSSEQRCLYCWSTLNYPQLKPNANEKIALLWNYFKRTRVSRMDWRKSWV